MMEPSYPLRVRFHSNTPKTEVVPSLVGATCTKLDDRLYCFGGHNGKAFVNSVWSYNADLQRWQHCDIASDAAPHPRSNHVAVPLNSHQILIHGGIQHHTYGDMWILHVNKVCQCVEAPQNAAEDVPEKVVSDAPTTTKLDISENTVRNVADNESESSSRPSIDDISSNNEQTSKECSNNGNHCIASSNAETATQENVHSIGYSFQWEEVQPLVHTGLKEQFYTSCNDMNAASSQPSPTDMAKMKLPGRYWHTANKVKDKVYFFGGSGVREFCNSDIYVYDTSNNTLYIEPVIGLKPLPRHHHTMQDYGDSLFLYGGITGISTASEEFDKDMYEFNTTSSQWSKVILTSGMAPELLYPVSCVIGSFMFFLFGNPEQKALSVTIFNLEHRLWYKPVKLKRLKYRHAHCVAALSNDRIMVFGGTDSYGGSKRICGASHLQVTERSSFSLLSHLMDFMDSFGISM